MIAVEIDTLVNGIMKEDALNIFDNLETVNCEFMFGRWSGAEIPTQHEMDGLLDAINWYGKQFVSEDDVYPLVMGSTGSYSIIPFPILIKLSLNFPIFRKPFLRPVNSLVTRLVQSKSSQARLRMVEFRGKTSATMIYDRMPIHDHFRRIDDNNVMGLMDFKWTSDPYFFMLTRE